MEVVCTLWLSLTSTSSVALMRTTSMSGTMVLSVCCYSVFVLTGVEGGEPPTGWDTRRYRVSSAFFFLHNVVLLVKIVCGGV